MILVVFELEDRNKSLMLLRTEAVDDTHHPG